MKRRLKFRKMSWDPRSMLYVSQFPRQVHCYLKGQPIYENLGEYKCYSCPDLTDCCMEVGK